MADTADTADSTADRAAHRPGAAPLATRGLSKSFGSVDAVVDLDLELEPGEVFGFLGPNGAGKSTTIGMVMGLLAPTRGSARVFGHDVRADGLAARRHVGFLPDSFTADPRVTGERLFGLVSRLRGTDVPAYAHELVDRFDAQPATAMGNLSSGNRQKIGLVMALMHRPPLLVLDEPTAALDPLMQAAFEESIREATERGQTVLLSSHNLPEVEDLCDRAGIIRAGRLVTLETISGLRRRQFLQVVASFGEPVDVGRLLALDGVRDVGGVAGPVQEVRLEVHGEVAPVLSALGELPVQDVEIERSTLEEIFLAHYAGTGEGT